jgi:hypothetical protein
MSLLDGLAALPRDDELPAVWACGKDRYDVERHDPDIGSGMVGMGGT